MTEQTKKQITALALANGFKLKAQPDGSMALNPYVFDFAHAVAASAQPPQQSAQPVEVQPVADLRPDPKAVPVPQPPQQSAQPVEALGLTFVPWSKEAEMLESWTQPAQPVEVQRVALTDAQIDQIWRLVYRTSASDLNSSIDWLEAGIRNAEAHHGIKPASSEGSV